MSVFKILTNEEEKDFELVPKFDSLSQNHFFKLTSGVSESISEMKSDSNKILFILMFGYFKATHRFFEIQKNDENYLYIANRNNLNIFDFNTVTSRTQQRYKQIIKSYFNVNEYNKDIELKLKNYATELANNFTHRKKIFFSLIDYSKKLNIEIPSYTILSKIIGDALSYQTKNILFHLKSIQNDERLRLLDDFTNKDENFKNRYNIGNFKKLGHSTNKREMNGSLVQLMSIQSKFHMLKPIIDEIGITDKVAQYYSKWLEQSKITQLTQKDSINSQFLLLSFVKYQYFIRNDNLMDRFIAIVQSIKSSLLRHQKDLYFENEPKQKALIQSLEDSNLLILNEVNQILDNDQISDSIKIATLKSLVKIKTVNLKILLEQKTFLETANLDRFDFIEKASQSLQGKLSGIVKLLEFDKKSSNKHLITAIKYFKDSDNLKRNFPIDFLEDDEKIALIDNEGKIKISLYKALLFLHISDGMHTPEQFGQPADLHPDTLPEL
ncbi:DUF4158 domain-containing protein, partial [Aliarcobacter butzleri]